jgi:galactose-1-phosphate uridylyltransferase
MPTHRTAERSKVMAGSELGAGVFVNEMSPEEAAIRLRAAASDAT